MDVGIQSLWVILTVMVPGLVFYGTFWSILKYLNVVLPFITEIEQSETLYLCLLFAVMFIIQIFGIATESFFFQNGPYRNKNAAYQEAFNRRYVIISEMDPEKDYHVERILSQFFMSHNIAVGLTINLIWVTAYLFLLNKELIFSYKILFIGLLVTTMLSWYVSIRRFFLSCEVLYAHQHKNETKRSKMDTKIGKDISYNLIIVACMFIAGGIGNNFGNLIAGSLVGLAFGFLIVSALIDSISKKPVFSWDKIPGEDEQRLKEFLIQEYGFDWVAKSVIKKSENLKTIKVSTDGKSILIRLNEEKNEVVIEINENKIGKFIVKNGNGRLNIYRTVYGKKELRINKLKYFILLIGILIGVAYLAFDEILCNSCYITIAEQYIVSIFLMIIGLAIAIWGIVSISIQKITPEEPS